MFKSNYEDVNVFFGCSMRGGYSFVSKDDLAKIPDIIQALGCRLVSNHQTQPGISEREKDMTPREIHDRDYAWLTEADHDPRSNWPGWIMGSLGNKAPGTDITWKDVARALQKQLGLRVHVGAKTVFWLQGKTHYLGQARVHPTRPR